MVDKFYVSHFFIGLSSIKSMLTNPGLTCQPKIFTLQHPYQLIPNHLVNYKICIHS